jgi:hypothetical protein
MNTRGSRKRALTTNIDEQETTVESKKQRVMVSTSKISDETIDESNARIRLLIQELDRLGHGDTARHLEQQSV